MIFSSVINENIGLPTTQPPHLVTDDAIWYSHVGEGHSLVAVRHDRMTDLPDEISRISPTDFFLPGPGGKVCLHRWDVGLIDPNIDDQPELMVNFRKIGCAEPRGSAFDDNGKLWVLDERGPKLFEVNPESHEVRMHDISGLHRESNDPTDPSPYPWHSCVWQKGSLLIGCCDAARIDIIRPAEEQR